MSSNNEIENVELEDRNALKQEVVKLRESLKTTKELLFVSENVVRSYSAKLKDFEKSKILNEIDLSKNKNKNICNCENLKFEITI